MKKQANQGKQANQRRQANQRHRLVRQARRHGVRDEAVLSAIARVPRERFVPRSLVWSAFSDGPLPIGKGQTISQPAMVAMMAEAARIGPEDHVLEIGAGSGYGAAVLRSLARSVVTVERLEPLADKARAALERCGFGDVTVVVGDGTLGWQAEAPYNAIVVTAAGPSVPPPLNDQLVDGGRLVMPVGSRHHSQHLMRFTRGAADAENADGTRPVREERLVPVRFVPLIGAHGFEKGPG